jgi:hypothetical protein
MRDGSKKDSALDRRLREIEDEIHAVRRNVKVHLRTLKKADAAMIPHGVRPPAAPADTRRPAISRGSPHEETAAPPAGGGALTGAGAERGAVWTEKEVTKPDADRRFANYFVSGNLDSVRPLRQERRLWRNKAIAMVVIVLLVLAWVIYLLRR